MTESKKQIINFDTLQLIATRKKDDINNCIILNTLIESQQHCLILNTIPIKDEEITINQIIEKKQQAKWCIIVYGKNYTDETVERKCKQMRSIGFTRIYSYNGGIFEWLLLQEIYGETNFPTTTRHIDLLEFKPFASNENEIIFHINPYMNKTISTK